MWPPAVEIPWKHAGKQLIWFNARTPPTQANKLIVHVMDLDSMILVWNSWKGTAQPAAAQMPCLLFVRIRIPLIILIFACLLANMSALTNNTNQPKHRIQLHLQTKIINEFKGGLSTNQMTQPTFPLHKTLLLRGRNHKLMGWWWVMLYSMWYYCNQWIYAGGGNTCAIATRLLMKSHFSPWPSKWWTWLWNQWSSGFVKELKRG